MPPFSRDTIRSIYHIRAGDVFRLKKVRERGREGEREGEREGGREGGREGEREGGREGGRERGRERGRRHNMKKISAFLPPLVDQSNRHCNVT